MFVNFLFNIIDVYIFDKYFYFFKKYIFIYFTKFLGTVCLMGLMDFSTIDIKLSLKKLCKKSTRITINRSPHIFSKSKESFALVTYKRSLSIQISKNFFLYLFFLFFKDLLLVCVSWMSFSIMFVVNFCFFYYVYL